MRTKMISICFLAILLVGLFFAPALVQAQPANDAPFTWGNGADGDLNITAGNTYNIDGNNHPGRTCANGGDGVAYEVIGLTRNTATLNTSPAPGCLNIGDEIMLINLQGSQTNTGNYELLRIKNISASLVTFASNKTRYYGINTGDDSGLGASQHVMLKRIPNYNNLTLGGNLAANAWNGKLYGVLAFKVKGNWSGSGSINLDGQGYRGGAQGKNGARQGESWPGPGTISELANGGGGAGRNAGHIGCPGGQGNYAGGLTVQACASTSGAEYGDLTLDRLIFGSGGGGRGDGNGGSGGGAVFIAAYNTNFRGSISTKGTDGQNTGGGSGGSIRIEGANLLLGSLNAMGGKSSVYAVSAGVGRIALYYVNRWSSSLAQPNPYVQQVLSVPTLSPTHTPNVKATETSRSLTLTAATGTAAAKTATAKAKTPNYNATGTALAKTATAKAKTPDYNATGTSLAKTATALVSTPDYNATGTSLAKTATALVSTPDYNATGTALALTATAQGPTETPDFFATGTAWAKTATSQAATPTSSPDYGATGTAIAETATALVMTSTPNFGATGTALAKTATAFAASPTPNLNATSTARSLTATAQAATSTPDYNATGTSQALTATASVPSTTPTASGGGNGGNGNGGNGSGQDDTPTPSGYSFGSGNNCALTLNVYVYIDTNNDSIMAAQGEGVNMLQVNFLDTSYGKVGQSYSINGKAVFCVPDYLHNQTVRVDIPYLQRTGVMQIPQDNNKGIPLEMWFRLEPPTLPVYIP